MKTTTLILAATLAATSLAAPSASRASLRSRLLAARDAGAPVSTKPLQTAANSTFGTTGKLPTTTFSADDAATTDTDLNWAGASQSAPSGLTYTSVIGTWEIQPISATSTDGTWGLYSWVGIDGISDSGGLWQSGIWQELEISGGTTTLDETIPWYCWYPTSCVYFSGLTTNPGDTVTVQVGVTSSSVGTIYFENVSSGQSISFTVDSASTSLDLSSINAEWIVEDTAIQGVPLPSFSPITFSACSATLSDGSTQDASGSLIWEVINEDTNNIDLTASTPDASTVVVDYNV